MHRSLSHGVKRHKPNSLRLSTTSYQQRCTQRDSKAEVCGQRHLPGRAHSESPDRSFRPRHGDLGSVLTGGGWSKPFPGTLAGFYQQLSSFCPAPRRNNFTGVCSPETEGVETHPSPCQSLELAWCKLNYYALRIPTHPGYYNRCPSVLDPRKRHGW